MSKSGLLSAWFVCLCATVSVILACVYFIDSPVAIAFSGNVRHVGGIGRLFAAPVMVATEGLVILSLAIVRIVRGDLPDYAKAVFLACCVSLSTFSANEFVLKPFFGRQNVSAFLLSHYGGRFHFFRGSQHSSFPSGHMVAATAFVGVIIRLYPRTVWLGVVGLLAVGTALVVGDWHFIGDIVAGAFVGSTAGILAAALWQEHADKARITDAISPDRRAPADYKLQRPS